MKLELLMHIGEGCGWSHWKNRWEPEETGTQEYVRKQPNELLLILYGGFYNHLHSGSFKVMKEEIDGNDTKKWSQLNC